MWDVAGRQVYSWKCEFVQCLQVSPDGRSLAVGVLCDDTYLFDLTTGVQLRRLPAKNDTVGAGVLAFSPDSRLLAIGGGEGIVHCFDALTGQELRTLEGAPTAPTSVAFSPDRRFVLCAGLAYLRQDGIFLWDLERGALVRNFPGVDGPAAFSTDGTNILSVGGLNNILIFDAAGGRELSRFEVGTGALRCLAISPDGRRLLTGSNTDFYSEAQVREKGTDNTVRLIDAADGRELCRFDGHTADVTAVAFSLDGRTAASASADSTVRLWRV
jgi:WD40 repeat protein